MDWKMLLACVTGSVDEELLLRNEYLVTAATAQSQFKCHCRAMGKIGEIRGAIAVHSVW